MLNIKNYMELLTVKQSERLIEQKFKKQLLSKYQLIIGSSANGIDPPSKNILTDIKVTSVKQP